MSRFRTNILIESFPFELNSNSKVLSIGSCFSEEIGEKLKNAGFETTVNPTGIVFNPVSISRTIQRLVQGNAYTKDELVFDQGKYHSLDHHGRFSDVDLEAALDKINAELNNASSELSGTNVLILTLGSAFAYRHTERAQIVANCHKIPQREFEKVLFRSDEIVERLNAVISSLSAICEGFNVILTVSPVRHLKDGPLQNQVSKSHLRIACEELVSTHSNCHYFPAYELVLDELRDYRFYARDMLHPSAETVDFIWEKFQQAAMSDSIRERTRSVEKLRLRLNHRSYEKSNEAEVEEVRDKIAALLKAGS